MRGLHTKHQQNKVRFPTMQGGQGQCKGGKVILTVLMYFSIEEDQII